MKCHIGLTGKNGRFKLKETLLYTSDGGMRDLHVSFTNMDRVSLALRSLGRSERETAFIFEVAAHFYFWSHIQGLEGTSGGVLMALMNLQLMIECSFKPRVSGCNLGRAQLHRFWC